MPIIRVEMLKGRTAAQKQELAVALTRETARIARCAEKDVDVILFEVDPSDWTSGGVPSLRRSQAQG